MNGYQATRDDQGILTIHRVPIFVACSRGENDFDDAWITKAVQKAFQAASEGYHPPLHIRHHDAQSDVRAAGYFRVLGTDSIQFKGKLRTAIFADLVITDPAVQDEVLSRRLPYRSVEIFDVDSPAIDSLALLDHEAPYLELPMLMVSNVADAGATMAQSVALARIPSPWSGSGATREAAMVACFRRGQAAHVLFQHPNDNPNQNPKPVHMACDEEKMADNYDEEKMMDEEKDGEQMQDGLMDVAAIVAAIEDGTISVADMDAIVAAVMARKAAAEVTEEVEVEEEAAPAAAPGESMSRGKASVAMARALGEVAALRARLEQREQADQRREAVSVAMKRLDGRPLGSDLEKKLVAFHAKHGAKAFAAHVDAMVETFASYSEDPRAAFFAGQTQAVPEVANRYLKDGVEAVDRAARFAREHAELVRGGHTRMSLDRYVELNMTRN